MLINWLAIHPSFWECYRYPRVSQWDSHKHPSLGCQSSNSVLRCELPWQRCSRLTEKLKKTGKQTRYGLQLRKLQISFLPRVLYLQADTISIMGHLTSFGYSPSHVASPHPEQPIQCTGFSTVTGRGNCRISIAKFSQFFGFLLATRHSPCSPQAMFICWLVSCFNIAVVNVLSPPLERMVLRPAAWTSPGRLLEMQDHRHYLSSTLGVRICTLAQPLDSHTHIQVLESLLVASLALILFCHFICQKPHLYHLEIQVLNQSSYWCFKIFPIYSKNSSLHALFTLHVFIPIFFSHASPLSPYLI